MKTIKLIALAVATICIFSAFKSSTTNSTNDGYYAFIVVDGVYNSETGYASSIIHYSGYESCKRLESNHFFAEARRAFSDHLQAYYSHDFPNGENSNFAIIEMKKHSTSQMLKTRAEAEQRMTEWIADQKNKGYAVKTTTFSYSCE